MLRLLLPLPQSHLAVSLPVLALQSGHRADWGARTWRYRWPLAVRRRSTSKSYSCLLPGFCFIC